MLKTLEAQKERSPLTSPESRVWWDNRSLETATDDYSKQVDGVLERQKEVTKYLMGLIDADQASRVTNEVSDEKGDAERLASVMHLLDSDQIKSPMEKILCAFILHHAPFVKGNQKSSDYYNRAHKLANEALSEGSEAYWLQYESFFAKHSQGQTKFGENPSVTDIITWISKATEDRALLSEGKQQKHGTQYDLVN